MVVYVGVCAQAHACVYVCVSVGMFVGVCVCVSSVCHTDRFLQIKTLISSNELITN